MFSAEETDRGGALRRILLATTLTVHSDRALDRAVALAAGTGAGLRLVHAIEPGILPESYVMENVERAGEEARRDLAECGVDPDPAEIDILLGDPVQAILGAATVWDADLVVMGLSRETGMTRAFRGTTTAQVARRAPCPVLAVKRRAVRNYGRIVVAVDLQPASAAALEFALAAFPGASFCVLHADESLRPAEDVAREVALLASSRCAAAGLPGPGSAEGPEIVVRAGPAALALPEAIEEWQPDLVAVGTHGRAGMANFLLGSVAEALLDTLAFDFLVVRAAPGGRNG